jgi:hypothetical protein
MGFDVISSSCSDFFGHFETQDFFFQNKLISMSNFHKLKYAKKFKNEKNGRKKILRWDNKIDTNFCIWKFLISNHL